MPAESGIQRIGDARSLQRRGRESIHHWFATGVIPASHVVPAAGERAVDSVSGQAATRGRNRSGQ